MIRIVFSFLFALILCLLVMPLIIKIAKRLKFRQTVLHYVESHAGKSGTPTMGGIAFVLSISVATLIASHEHRQLIVMCVAVMIGYGIIGFLDDFIKVFFKQNKGLSAIQKLIFQSLLALIISLFAYNNPIVSDRLYLPFSFTSVNLGVVAVPFYMLVFLSLSNAVNLVDGLDGLAASVTATYVSFTGVCIAIALYSLGVYSSAYNEMQNVLCFAAAIVGALIAFQCFNCFPAKIFMGDTGSLALGGAIASIAIVTGTSLLVPILGVTLVVTCLSVIIQVACFKLAKKRVFLMTPIHHHFEKKGVHENRIVRWYVAITCIAGASVIVLTLM